MDQLEASPNLQVRSLAYRHMSDFSFLPDSVQPSCLEQSIARANPLDPAQANSRRMLDSASQNHTGSK